MDIYSVRSLLKTRSIFDIPLRVTYYARVSSESDEQLNSLGNQISYYEDLIKKNRNWTFVPGYIDEGLSGISTKKRENFNRMITEARDDIFDLVITKEISRFARNTLDSIQYTRQLLGCGVGVFFQNDNINTLDEDSELRLSIMSSIAQDELRKLSSRVKFGHQQAIKSKVVLGNSRFFGYTKKDGKLVIDEAEAPMVRELFSLYATDNYSLKQIENIFWDKGYRNHNGKKISHTTMSNIIANPKYKGYYVGNKVKVIDMFTKQQKFLPPEEWVMFKDETGAIVPSIVDEKLWEKANAVLKRRSDDVKNRHGICNHANLLTGKLYCTHCGAPYYRKESKSKDGVLNSRWICSGKLKNGTNSCPSFSIYEDEIKPLILDVTKNLDTNRDAIIAKYTELFKALEQQNELAKLLEQAKQKHTIALKKKSKLLEYNVSGAISDADFIQMNQQCAEELRQLESEIAELETQQNSKDEFRRQIEAVKVGMQEMSEAAEDGAITIPFVNQYIDRIDVTPLDGTTLRLDIKIFTGSSTSVYLDKLKVRAGQMFTHSAPSDETSTAATTFSSESRTGQMFKKMIEAYEQGLQ